MNIELQHRSIRSFVLRQGRFSPAQREAYDTLLPRFGIPYSAAPLDLARVFGRANPKILEIGFGMGETTAAIAALQPEHDFLAIDVHAPGVGSLLRLIERDRLTNVRIVSHDAVDVVRPHDCPRRACRQRTCSFPIRGRKSDTTSGACCNRRSCTPSRSGSRPAATCTRPPTGRITRSRCSRR